MPAPVSLSATHWNVSIVDDAGARRLVFPEDVDLATAMAWSLAHCEDDGGRLLPEPIDMSWLRSAVLPPRT